MNFFKKKIVEQEQDLETSKVDLEAINLDLESVREELKTAQEQAAHYQLQYTELNELFEELSKENETLKADNALLASDTASVTLKAAEIAADIVAEHIGTEAVEITEDIQELSIKESLTTLKGQAQLDFYNSNKEEIFKALKH